MKLVNIFNRRNLATIVVAGFLASYRASAAIETKNYSYVIAPIPTNYKDTRTITPFDSSLGTLDSVTISAQATGQFTQRYQNFSPSSADLFTISQNLDLIVSLLPSGASILPDLILSSGNQTYLTQPYTGTAFFSGVSGGMTSFQAATSSSVTLFTGLDQFADSGLAFQVAANGSSSITETNGNYAAGGQTLAGLNLSVTYDYIPVGDMIAVPESATWTWFAGVFAAAGLLTCIGKRQPRSVMRSE